MARKPKVEPVAIPLSDSPPARSHRLEGLEPDNLLAFMALLGLLRALDEARPDWNARAFWDMDHHPWRPVLTLAEGATQSEVAQAAAEGVTTLAKAHKIPSDFRDLKFKLDDYLAARQDAAANRETLLDALMCDGAIKDDGTLHPTPYCLLFGQGHQHFLDRLHDVPAGILPAKLAKRSPPPDLTSSQYLASVLFASWLREDPTDGFRWDPAEDRRYALRANDPSGDAATTQHGANRLAAVALPLLAGVAIARRGETRFLATGAAYMQNGGIAFTWPLWRAGARLSGIKALLSHPGLSAIVPDAKTLRLAGIDATMRAHRISVGKFFCITRGQSGD